MKPRHIIKLLEENFNEYLYINNITIKTNPNDSRYYIIKNMSQGVNCGVRKDESYWKETIVNHIKWQLGL